MGGILVFSVFLGGVLGISGRPDARTAATSVEQPVDLAMIEVHVAGWVLSPGVVAVPEGSIVATAVDVAGGLRPGALPGLINLAALLQSGDQVVVPGPDSSLSEAGDGLISINRAGESELEALPGVGPVLAANIIKYRDANGPFREVEDLLQVSGIGEAKLASIRDLIRVP